VAVAAVVHTQLVVAVAVVVVHTQLVGVVVVVVVVHIQVVEAERIPLVPGLVQEHTSLSH
jgi:hypothetical protein